MQPNHVAVMEEVCCPANKRTISQPVTSESENPRPALITFPVFGSVSSRYVKSMIFCKKSSAFTSPVLRAAIIFEKMETISALASSRSLCFCVGADGHSVDNGVNPPSNA